MNDYKDLLNHIATNNQNIMYIIDQDAPSLSYNNSELLHEAISDQLEFGSGCQVLVWCDPKDVFIKDYDFILNDNNDNFMNHKKQADVYQITIEELIFILKLQSNLMNEYRIIPANFIKKFAKSNKKKSEASKKGWAKLTPKERSRIARERGRAGAMKRWRKQ